MYNYKIKLILAANRKFDSYAKTAIEDAVNYCYEHAVSGDAVLLSPACASWGMFPNYEERGRIFKEIVKGFKE